MMMSYEFKLGDSCPFCDGILIRPNQCENEKCWFNKVTFAP